MSLLTTSPVARTTGHSTPTVRPGTAIAAPSPFGGNYVTLPEQLERSVTQPTEGSYVSVSSQAAPSRRGSYVTAPDSAQTASIGSYVSVN